MDNQKSTASVSQSKMTFAAAVLPSSNIQRDVKWYQNKAGFEAVFGDDMYVGIRRDHVEIHLQWHAGTNEDPLIGGSVLRIFVEDIHPIFKEFVDRGTVKENALNLKTAWGTDEFGFYDLNNNAIFIVADSL